MHANEERVTTLALKIVSTLRDIPENEWNNLLREGSSPFVEHTWLSCLEEAACVGGETGWLPRHLALYDGTELIAAAPAYLKMHSEGEFVFDWSWAELASRLGIAYYPKLVLAVPFTPATGDRILVHPERDRATILPIFARALRRIASDSGLSSVHVLFSHEAEAHAFQEAGFAVRHGVQYHWTNATPKFETYEDFLTTLPSKKRTQLRRERKQPALDGVTIESLTPEEYTPAMARTMHELYTLTVDKYFHGRRYLNAHFFELLSERFAHRLAWTVARKEGTVLAGAFNVKKDGILYGRYWGSHEELPFLHFNVCYYHGVEAAIRDGLTTFNPGAGGEHKKVRGFAPTLTYSAHHIEDARFRGFVEPFLERERQHVAAYVAAT